ncbi:hypothetical protein ES707_19339 [subsurface metagenome]
MNIFEIEQVKCRIITLVFCFFLSMVTSNVLGECHGNVRDRFRVANENKQPAYYNENVSRGTDGTISVVGHSDDIQEYSFSDEWYLSKLWELDENKPRGKYVTMPHRLNYILPVSFNSTPNEGLYQEVTGQDVQKTEVVFQISQKIKLWQDVLGEDVDLWLGYIQ